MFVFQIPLESGVCMAVHAGPRELGYHAKYEGGLMWAAVGLVGMEMEWAVLGVRLL